jgi:hypothetical protein
MVPARKGSEDMEASEAPEAEPRAAGALSAARLAARAGVTDRFVERLVDLGIIRTNPSGGFESADVQRGSPGDGAADIRDLPG